MAVKAQLDRLGAFEPARAEMVRLADYGGVAAIPCRFGRRVLRTTAMPEITVPTIAMTISVPTMASKTVDCIQVRMRRP